MAKNSRYCLPFRRRREGKTDYKARKALVLSGKPRLVARRTRKNLVTQIISAKPQGDVVVVAAHSRELMKKYGWNAPRGNIPAGYLTGLLCGLKASSKGIKEAIFDIGSSSPSKGAIIFSVLKGVLDAGVSVPHDSEKLPSEKRISGTHIQSYAKTLSSDESPILFSQYRKNHLAPETLPEHVKEVKKEILKLFSKGGEKS